MRPGFCKSEAEYARRGRRILALLLAGVGIAVMGLGTLQCGREGESGNQVQTPPPVAHVAPAPPQPVDVVEVPAIPIEPIVAPEPAPPPRPVTFAEAETLYATRDYARAAEAFATYAQDHPQNVWGHYMLGLAHMKAGSPARAESGFIAALQIDPDHFKARTNFARLLIEADRLKEAEFQATRAMAIDSSAHVAHRILGRIYRAQGQNEQAITAYKTALACNDRDVWAMNNLGLLRIEEGRYGDALLPLARAVQLRDDIAAFHNNLGVALERRGAYRAAEEAYRQASALTPPSEKAAVSLARVAGLTESPAAIPINLGVLARQFTEELNGVLQAASSPAPPATLVSDHGRTPR